MIDRPPNFGPQGGNGSGGFKYRTKNHNLHHDDDDDDAVADDRIDFNIDQTPIERDNPSFGPKNFTEPSREIGYFYPGLCLTNFWGELRRKPNPFSRGPRSKLSILKTKDGCGGGRHYYPYEGQKKKSHVFGTKQTRSRIDRSRFSSQEFLSFQSFKLQPGAFQRWMDPHNRTFSWTTLLNVHRIDHKSTCVAGPINHGQLRVPT